MRHRLVDKFINTIFCNLPGMFTGLFFCGICHSNARGKLRDRSFLWVVGGGGGGFWGGGASENFRA